MFSAFWVLSPRLEGGICGLVTAVGMSVEGIKVLLLQSRDQYSILEEVRFWKWLIFRPFQGSKEDF